MARGRRGRGSATEVAATPRRSSRLVPVHSDAPEGSGGRAGSVSRARRGRGGRTPRGRGGAAPALPRGHTAVVAHEFLVGLHAPLRSWLRLPESFAEVFGGHPPAGLWLQKDDCANGPSWVHAGHDSSGRLVLMQGWKTFARSQKLEHEQILHFCFNGEDTLFVKIFGYLGGRAGCCLESESSGEDDSSSSEEEENEEDSSSVKVEPSSSSSG